MENIIQQFMVVFGVNSKPLEDGVKKSENSLKSFAKTLNKIASSYLSYKIFKGLINALTDFNVNLGQSIALIGGNAENISAMGNALKRFGGDTDSLINSMKSLNSQLQEAKYGGGALIEVAKKYGVSLNPYTTADKALESLARQMQNYDRNTRVAIASQLGLDESITRAFADGGKDLAKFIEKQKELGTATQEDIKISNNFNNSILDLKDLFNALMRDFGRVVLPAFTKLAELFFNFVNFLRKHKVLVIGFFATLGAVLTPILITLTKIAIASAAAFAPFIAIGAVIAGIAVVIEDLYYYFKGYDSVTGDLVKKFPFLKSILEIIKPLVVGIFDTFNAIVNLITNPSWDNFVNIFKVIGHAISEFILKPYEFFSSLIDKVIEKFPSLAPLLKPLQLVINGIKDTIKWIFDAISNFSIDGIIKGLNSISDKAKDIGKNILDTINPMNWFSDNETPSTIANIPQVPARPIVDNNSTSNTYNINNNINQNISSATPKQLADGTNQIMIQSINQQRQQQGAF